jgi:diadenosine tetraphosphate (Ap4A) HIT family hydrolase
MTQNDDADQHPAGPTDSSAPPTPGVPHPRHLAHMPVGWSMYSRLDITAWSTFPYLIESKPRLRLRLLEEPVVPEPPRAGEDGPEGCPSCAKADSAYIWTDETWRLAANPKPTAGATHLFLEPRVHCDLIGLPPQPAAELGPVLQRIERAVMDLGGVGRVHYLRWGDGAAHMHWQIYARPEGFLQLRGALAMLWLHMLPPTEDEVWRSNQVRIAAALAAEGGTAHVG